MILVTPWKTVLFEKAIVGEISGSQGGDYEDDNL
jgi:hypothetical protein